MQRCAPTSTLILLSFGVGALPSWAADAPAVRTNLGLEKHVRYETRWQATDKTYRGSSPWILEASVKRKDQQETSGNSLLFKDVQVSTFSRRNFNYAVEALQKRSHTTFIQHYALSTFQEVSFDTYQPATRSKEVGGWMIRDVEVPATIMMSKTVMVPATSSTLVPYYRTVISTASVPVGPLLTTIQAAYSTRTWQVRPVQKYRTLTKVVQVPTFYDGPLIEMNGTYKDSIIGTCQVHPLTGTWTFSGSLVNDTSKYLPYLEDYAPGNVSWNRSGAMFSYASNLAPNRSVGNYFGGQGRIEDHGDHDELVFQSNPRYGWFWRGFWAGETRVRLNGHIQSFADRTVSYDEPYTENQGQWVTEIVPAPYQVQLEHLTKTPLEKVGSTGTGVYWWHYHGPHETCPFYEPVPLPRKTATGTSYDLKELDEATKNAGAAGRLSYRLSQFIGGAPSQFKKAYHHTNVYPEFEDDVITKISTKSTQVFDHSEWKYSPIEIPTMTWEKKNLFRVAGWDETLGACTHSHQDPTLFCENTHLATASPSPGMVSHSATPLLVPCTRHATASVWVTRPVIVTELVSVKATRSVPIKTVPGEEISEATSDWSNTGDMRTGEGTSSIEVDKREVVLGTLYLNVPSQSFVPASRTGGRAMYLSDFGLPQSTVNLSGSKVRASQQSARAIASQAKPWLSLKAPEATKPKAPPPGEKRKKD